MCSVASTEGAKSGGQLPSTASSGTFTAIIPGSTALPPLLQHPPRPPAPDWMPGGYSHCLHFYSPLRLCTWLSILNIFHGHWHDWPWMRESAELGLPISMASLHPHIMGGPCCVLRSELREQAPVPSASPEANVYCEGWKGSFLELWKPAYSHFSFSFHSTVDSVECPDLTTLAWRGHCQETPSHTALMQVPSSRLVICHSEVRNEKGLCVGD